MEKAMLRMVLVARMAKKNDDALMELGFESTPFWDIYGEMVDLIYGLLGEDTETLTESITYQALNNEHLDDHGCAKMLMAEYKRNHGG